MDRRVKERLIGASILVVLIVLIVPELLSGPKPAAPRTRGVAGCPRCPSRCATSRWIWRPARRPRGCRQPQAAAASRRRSQPASQPAAQPSASESPPTARRRSAPTRGAAPHGRTERRSSPPLKRTRRHPAACQPRHAVSWAVQLGSFAKPRQRGQTGAPTEGAGLSVYVLSSGTGPAQRYRVRVGPWRIATRAERTAAKLKAMGHAVDHRAAGALIERLCDGFTTGTAALR